MKLEELLDNLSSIKFWKTAWNMQIKFVPLKSLLNNYKTEEKNWEKNKKNKSKKRSTKLYQTKILKVPLFKWDSILKS